MSAPAVARAASFGSGVAAYRRARPSYPDEAVRWLLPQAGCRVLDLAAGTGKLSERLVALGYEVVAVEPSAEMRAELTDAVPTATVLDGTAEDIPLPDGDVDAVVVGQAWHWFDPTTALPQIRRVLRPGGSLGVMWNVRDAAVGWVRELTEILHRGDALTPSHQVPRLDEHFHPLGHRVVRWEHVLPAEDLRTLAASRSHTLTLSARERDALLDAVDQLRRTHPDLAGKDQVALPYRTLCWRSQLVGDSPLPRYG